MARMVVSDGSASVKLFYLIDLEHEITRDGTSGVSDHSSSCIT